MVTSKHPRPQWLTMDQAIKHCTQGIGIWDWASNDQGEEPDIVLACCGDTPTLEALAAVTIMKDYLPDVKIRFINVVDLMKLQSHHKHPHGLTDEDYDMLFTKDKPIIFAFHGYPSLIHELLYYRHNRNLHVYGYQEEGNSCYGKKNVDVRKISHNSIFRFVPFLKHWYPKESVNERPICFIMFVGSSTTFAVPISTRINCVHKYTSCVPIKKQKWSDE
jgi:phosphoketolase